MNYLEAIPALAKDDAQPRFDDRYIYAGTYAYTLISKLLTEPERERVIGAASIEELENILKETYFGQYFIGSKDIDAALGDAMVDAKKTLTRLSPNPHLLNILWLRYDFYNLKILLRSQRAGTLETSGDSIIPLGIQSHATLERAIKSVNGAILHNDLAAAFSAAPSDNRELDTFMETRYLEAALKEAELTGKPFAVRYTRLLINLFAILSALRAHARKEQPVYIAVSDYSVRDIVSEEILLTRLSHFGFSKHWQNAIERYKKSGDFSELDRAADDYLMKWLKRQSIMLDSPAPLFAYWHVFRENIQLIRAAHTARKVNMDERVLRDIIRTSYNAYVY